MKSRAASLLALTTSVLAICVLLMVFVDKPLAFFVRYQIDPKILDVFLTMTELGKAEYYVVPALLAFLIGRTLFLSTYPRPAHRFYFNVARIGLFVMASMAVSAIVIHTLKLTVGRARPKALLMEDSYGFQPFAFDTVLNSFPSGHSQTVWAALIPLVFTFPKVRVFLVALATLLAASRVMVSAHFLSDIIAGSFIGLMGALFVRQKWFSDVGPLSLPATLGPSPTNREEPVA